MKSIYQVSVGIAAYNEAANIKPAIESVLAQRGDNFILAEIIVISDGSSDATAKIVKRLKHPKIKLIEAAKRRGQNWRQNQIIQLMDKESDCLLRLEADTCLKSVNDLAHMVKAIPRDGRYSVITGKYEPIVSTNWFSRILTAGWNLKQEVFVRAMPWPNLYLFKIGLLSKQFLNNFRWDVNFQEDSYCYRRALESGLPIVRSEALIKFKLVNNLRDYLWQSAKFVKAGQLESTYSQIYRPAVMLLIALEIILKHGLKHPTLISLYLTVLVMGRLYQLLLPKFNPFWQIYRSSKKLAYE
jgi:glycosyltransferase involved in cell wall biosynthesis